MLRTSPLQRGLLDRFPHDAAQISYDFGRITASHDCRARYNHVRACQISCTLVKRVDLSQTLNAQKTAAADKNSKQLNTDFLAGGLYSIHWH